jgi:NADPH:quinone reductase-like Zn-dependent oxidoreductase
MRAMVYRSYGGPEKLELADLPRPVPGAGQVLVRVVAASVNPIDWKRAGGAMRPIVPVWFPAVPGYDIAGEVVESGRGVSGFPAGTQVHARIAAMKGGASAELAAVSADDVVVMPAGMDAGEAAGLPLAGMTALQGLRDRAGLPLQGARERVLVVGASGGVGHLAVQIAHAAGATVIGVCSGRNTALVASLGADEVVDYTQPNPYRGLAPVDIVLDCVAGNPSPWLPRLGAGGRYASTAPGARTFLQSACNLFTDKQVRPVLLRPRAADLRVLDGLVEARQLRVVVDSRFPLEALARAWERSREGRAAGKIVIDVGSG